MPLQFLEIGFHVEIHAIKLDFMLKSMPLSGMIFNVKPNFTELWWHESNFPFFVKSIRQPQSEKHKLFAQCQEGKGQGRMWNVLLVFCNLDLVF